MGPLYGTRSRYLTGQRDRVGARNGPVSKLVTKHKVCLKAYLQERLKAKILKVARREKMSASRLVETAVVNYIEALSRPAKQEASV
jgi:hypothetical protein